MCLHYVRPLHQLLQLRNGKAVELLALAAAEFRRFLAAVTVTSRLAVYGHVVVTVFAVAAFTAFTLLVGAQQLFRRRKPSKHGAKLLREPCYRVLICTVLALPCGVVPMAGAVGRPSIAARLLLHRRSQRTLLRQELLQGVLGHVLDDYIRAACWLLLHSRSLCLHSLGRSLGCCLRSCRLRTLFRKLLLEPALLVLRQALPTLGTASHGCLWAVGVPPTKRPGSQSRTRSHKPETTPQRWPCGRNFEL